MHETRARNLDFLSLFALKFVEAFRLFIVTRYNAVPTRTFLSDGRALSEAAQPLIFVESP